MTTIDTRTIGPYTAGEKPPPLTVRLYASSPPNLTGWTLALTCERDGIELTSWGSVAWLDPVLTDVTVTFPLLALDTGKTRQQFVIQVWAGNTVQKIASLPLCFYCHKAIGTVPAV